MFSVGDKVRRKARYRDKNGWCFGDSERVVSHVTVDGAYVTFEGSESPWLADDFDLVEPAKPKMPADSSPKVEIPPQTRIGEQAMGPVERVLTSPIPDQGHPCIPWQSIYDRMSITEPPVEAQVDRKKFMDDAIAAERDERANKRDSFTVGLELDETREELSASVRELAKVTKQRDEARQRLADTTREFNAVIDRLADAEKRLAIKDEQIEKLTIVPHDYDLLKKMHGEQQATIERLTNENAIFKQQNETLRSEISNSLSSMMPKSIVPRESIECMINTLSGVLLANGMKPMQQRCINETHNWLTGGQS